MTIKELVLNGYKSYNENGLITNGNFKNCTLLRKSFPYFQSDLNKNILSFWGMEWLEKGDIDDSENIYEIIIDVHDYIYDNDYDYDGNLIMEKIIKKKFYEITYSGFVDGMFKEDFTNYNQLQSIEKHIISDIFSNNIKMPEFSFIYLVKNNTSVKIGLANNPFARFSQLQTSTNVKLELLHFFQVNKKDVRQLEKQLHKFYDDKRLVGEWFNLTDEDVKYIYHSYKYLHFSNFLSEFESCKEIHDNLLNRLITLESI
jgi:hypothetical protein